MQFHQAIVRFAVFAALVVAPALLGYAADSSGAHVFARRDNGTNIVSRLVPDGTDVATMGVVDERVALQPATYSDRPAFTEWEYSGLDSRFTVLGGPTYYPQYGGWYWDEVVEVASGDSYEAYAPSDDANATNLVVGFEDEWGTNFAFTATRVRTDVTGYALGPQTNKVLASTLAVDRLWDRSTNSFLKAGWENGDSTGSRLVESHTGVDFYYRDGDVWSRRSRWGMWGLQLWGDDFVELTSGDGPGLWIGADWEGNNNIGNGPSIGYCNGFVTLRGSGYYGYIYFPTGVGEGRDNVFALTKDIDRATNDVYGAVSGALAGKASTADATLTELNVSSEWHFYPESYAGQAIEMQELEVMPELAPGVLFYQPVTESYGASHLAEPRYAVESSLSKETLIWPADSWIGGSAGPLIATRTVLSGCRLGPDNSSNPNRDKPLASAANATLTSRGTWIFANGLLEAARTNLAEYLSPAMLANSHVEIVTDRVSPPRVVLVEDGYPASPDSTEHSFYFANVTLAADYVGHIVAASLDGMEWFEELFPSGTTVATHTVLPGYRLGPDDLSNPNRDKPLASEAEAEALRTGKADKPATFTAGNLAALDSQGNPVDSTIPAANVVVAPDYNNTNNHFYATASDATSALAGFGNVGTNTWTTTRSGIGYLRMVGPQSNGPTVRLYVNEVDDAHKLFVWGSTNNDIIVPVFLNAGDSLKLFVSGSNPLSYVQLSMFYTD